MKPITLTAGAAAVGSYLAMQHLGRTYGATAEECRRRFPGDEITADPMAITTHATTIEAPPAHVWPWLVQMGWHRGAFYTARWVDRLLFPDNEPSAQQLLPQWQNLAVGDTVPDGAPWTECFFVVRDLEPERHLVLHSASHIPPSWIRDRGAWIDWTWAFVLEPLPAGRTRFLFRTRMRTGPWWLSASYLGLLIPADFIMSRQMLRGVKDRAERTTDADVTACREQDNDATQRVAPQHATLAGSI
jgi:hypothetical protein